MSRLISRVYHSHAHIEVHAIDTDRRVVLDAQVDVLGDTEAEVASLGEVALSQLVLLNLETTLKNFLGLRATDGDVNGNLFVTTDTEGTDSVSGLACNCLSSFIPESRLTSAFLRAKKQSHRTSNAL